MKTKNRQNLEVFSREATPNFLSALPCSDCGSKASLFFVETGTESFLTKSIKMTCRKCNHSSKKITMQDAAHFFYKNSVVGLDECLHLEVFTKLLLVHDWNLLTLTKTMEKVNETLREKA